MSSIASTLRRDFRRQTWLAVGALVLTGAALVATVLDLEMDRSAERYYRTAFEREQRIFAAGRLAADLRRWEVHADAAALRATANVDIDLGALSQTGAALVATAQALRDPTDTPRQSELVARLESAARGIVEAARGPSATVAPPAAAPTTEAPANASGAGTLTVAAATDVIRAVDLDQLPVVEEALLSLTTETHREFERALARVHVAGGTTRAALFGLSLLTATTAILLAAVLARSIQGSRRMVNDLNQMAHEDALTGLINRRQLDEVLPTEVARAQRAGSTVSVAMIDLDFFKRFNDQRGHAAGDTLLRGAAQAWREQLRPTDLLARYGGEEFTLVLPACSGEEAQALLARLRPLVPEGQTFSAGVATWNGVEAGSELLKRADRALLHAKRSGRNRTELASLDPIEPDAPIAAMVETRDAELPSVLARAP